MTSPQSFFTFNGEKHYLFTSVNKQGDLGQIKGVVMQCPICSSTKPFKDISHLITHYSSKDHLKTTLECHLRHDCGVPESAATWQLFLLWEEKNHVWRWLKESFERKEVKKAIEQG